MDWTLYLRTVLVLVFVLGLIGAASWLARRAGLGHGRLGRKGRRLAVVESLGLDNRRRLVLVRRDGVEHLLLVGGAAELVVESRISEPEAEQIKEQQP
ncbi:MAG TPA: flagellar biosynthetic protein FliO [Candidatus Sulfotelmatobacter sp.]|jgi:flagellar protein FliO/FliZ|nr:flagellar biosynthetic protein FliO [Candidatus Sulfotelmatobacter sp.]